MGAARSLRGRRREAALLRTLCRRTVEEGVAGVAVIRGPAGLGKSRLLGDAATHAAELGMAVAAGGAAEMSTAPPLAPLHEALRSSRPPLLGPDVLSGLAGVVDARLLLLERLASGLEAATASRAALIVLDDLHWADPRRPWRCSPTCPAA